MMNRSPLRFMAVWLLAGAMMLLPSVAALGRQREFKKWRSCPVSARPDAVGQQRDPLPQTADGADKQVTISLQVLELSPTKLKAMGFDLAKVLAEPKAEAGDAAKGAVDSAANTGTAGFSIVESGSETLRILEALRRRNLVKVVAEPTLVAFSGKPTRFMSGGQIAVPKPQKDGTVSIDYQPYGTIADLMPDIRDARTIHLGIRCEISELDYTNATQVGGETVPGILSRAWESSANLRNGQTLMLSGRSQDRTEVVSKGLGWISEVPYVGAIFRTQEEIHNEIATVILVRAEIGSPSGATTLGKDNGASAAVAQAAAGAAVRPAAIAGRPDNRQLRR
jgi:Flp pilus assembly secretin CpaC